MLPPPMEPNRVIVDYSSPNIAKDMHVGHLRSTLLGDCLARVLEYCKQDVIRINHIWRLGDPIWNVALLPKGGEFFKPKFVIN